MNNILKKTSKFDCFLFLVLIFGFVVMNNVVGEDEITPIVFIIRITITVFYSVMIMWLFGDYLVTLEDIDYGVFATIILSIVSVLFFLGLIESQNDYVYLFDSKYIGVDFFSVEKKYIFNIVILLFAVQMIPVRLALKKVCSLKNIVMYGMTIVCSTLISIFLFIHYSGAYLVSIGILYSICVGWLVMSVKRDRMGTMKKADADRIYKKNGLKWVLPGYIIMVCSIIAIVILSRNHNFMAYMQWNWNKSVESSNENPIEFIMFYGGWPALAAYLLCMIVFLVIAWKFVGHRNAEYKSLQLIYYIAFASLCVRAVGGTLYGLGLSPLSITPPFAGDVAVDDFVFVVILLISQKQNVTIDRIVCIYDELEEFKNGYGSSETKSYAGKQVEIEDASYDYAVFDYMLKVKADDSDDGTAHSDNKELNICYVGELTDNGNDYEIFLPYETKKAEIIVFLRKSVENSADASKDTSVLKYHYEYEVSGDEELIKRAVDKVTMNIKETLPKAGIMDSWEWVLNFL